MAGGHHSVPCLVCTQRSNGSTTYRYWYNDSGLLLRMEKGSTVYSFTYDPAGRPVSVTEGSNRYYYILNQQGDVVGLMNGNKKLVVEYYYDAWGRLIKTNGDLATTLGANNPLRYRGYVYDTETGLYYLQSRYYNPSWGRFINADDIPYLGIDGTPLSYNLFAYCKNNPVMGYDPTGHFGLVGAIILTGAFVGGLLGGFSAAATGDNVFEGFIEGVFNGALGAACGILIPNPWVAIGAATFGGMVIDFATQATTQFIEHKSVDLSEINWGRVVKTGFQTGIGTAVPQFGQGAANVVDAFGTALIWAEASAIISCVDVVVTSILETVRTPSEKLIPKSQRYSYS